jgi:hypothetical protein
VDVGEDGNGSLRDGRLYQRVRERDAIRERTPEITFLGPGAEAYVFTFGWPKTATFFAAGDQFSSGLDHRRRWPPAAFPPGPGRSAGSNAVSGKPPGPAFDRLFRDERLWGPGGRRS